MTEWLKGVAKRTPLRSVVRSWRELRNRRLPTQAVKYALIRQYAAEHGLRVLIETGTFKGDAVSACLESFSRIYSIELDDELYRNAAERFAPYEHVEILHGDSGAVLPVLLERVRDPCLFWLDGHYSRGVTARGAVDTPIEAELRAVLGHPVPGHVILIDDARLFVGRDGYPRLRELRQDVQCGRPDASYIVEHDIVRIVLK